MSARRALGLALLLSAFVGCSSAPKRPEPKTDRQCGAFCAEIDACLGSDYADGLKDQLCRLARCESGCRARVKAPAGYEGAFQFSRGTWKSLCYPIFDRKGMPSCKTEDSRNELCCAATCTAEMVRAGGIGHWPTCGKK